jgi:hypothetical protein
MISTILLVELPKFWKPVNFGTKKFKNHDNKLHWQRDTLLHRWGKKLQRIISVLYEINFIPC